LNHLVTLSAVEMWHSW